MTNNDNIVELLDLVKLALRAQEGITSGSSEVGASDAAATDMGKRDALEELSALVHHYSMGARLFHGYQRERSAGSLAVMHAALAAAKRSCEETAATEEVRNADDAA